MPYIDNFNSDSLDYCGFNAIEVFEETKGTQNGTSMGDNYMEGKYEDFDAIIMDRIDTTIGRDVWDKFSPKFKMQLWSFMFNSDSGAIDRYRWLAVLANTVNYDDFGGFYEAYTLNIIDKEGSDEWNQAVSDIVNSNNFYYDNLIECLNGQYATLGNNVAYENSWRYRPSDLDNLYDECSSPTPTPEPPNPNPNPPKPNPPIKKQDSSNNKLKFIGAALIIVTVASLIIYRKKI